MTYESRCQSPAPDEDVKDHSPGCLAETLARISSERVAGLGGRALGSQNLNWQIFGNTICAADRRELAGTAEMLGRSIRFGRAKLGKALGDFAGEFSAFGGGKPGGVKAEAVMKAKEALQGFARGDE